MQRTVLSGLVMAALTTLPARAVTVLPATLEELVRESVVVVHGTVVDVEGRWTVDRRTIESRVTLSVAETLKGQDADRVSFVVPGGDAGGRRLLMPGAPVFQPGDEVVVFLAGAAPMLPRPLGLSLGVYRVAAGRGGVPMVVPTPIVAGMPDGRVARGSSARQVRSLAAFSADVKGLGGGR